jgi:hypothetical protein
VSADPIGARDNVEAAIPRQRDAAGVMGYVAELQQFDDTMTAQEPDTITAQEPDTITAQEPGNTMAQEPEPDTMTAAEPPSGEEAEPAPQEDVQRRVAGTPRRVPDLKGKPPWTRTEVGLAVAFVVVGAVAIVGGAYALIAANRPPTGELPLPMPTVRVAAPELPAEPTPDGTIGPDGGAAAPVPSADGERVVPPSPRVPEATGAAPVAAADLTATYAREANTGLLGLTGYRGKITVSNRGAGPATTWEVTLSLQGGQTVSGVEGAEVRQEGELATFTPAAGAGEVAPGASVEFTFEVPGLLAGEPTGCAINGRPCD